MRVGWITSGNRERGNSARCIAFIIHDWFLKNGIDSQIIWMNQDDNGEGGVAIHQSSEIEEAIFDSKITHLIFQKVMRDFAPYYLNLAKRMGIFTVYTVDDFTEPDSKPMELAADAVITNSCMMEEYLWQTYQRKATTIPCAYEIDQNFYKKSYETEQPVAYWYGTLGNRQQAEEFKALMGDLQHKYEIIAPSGMGTIVWSLDTFYMNLVKADMTILPCLHPMSPMEFAKGEGRIVQSMILGIPVIVSPFPSLTRLITNGVNGLISYLNSPEEFKEYITYLQDAKTRETIGRAGRSRVINAYHIDTIGKKWLEVLTK